MKINNFILNIILRVILFAVSLYLFIWSLFRDYIIIGKFTFLVLSVIALLSVILYINRINKLIGSILLNTSLSDQLRSDILKNSSFEDIEKGLKKLNSTFQDAVLSKEISEKFLGVTIDFIKTGLIFLEGNEIVFINRSAKNLFSLSGNQKYGWERIRKMHNKLTKIPPGGSQIITVKKDNHLQKILVRKQEMKIHSKEMIILSFNNISDELSRQESESYKKLIQVLRHEIMNSTTPITSLSESLFSKIKKYKVGSDYQLNPSDFKSLDKGLKAIVTRSRGLSEFVNKYRKLTKLPEPQFEKISLIEPVENAMSLLSDKIASQNIELVKSFPEKDIIIIADKNYCEQVMLNLIKNAIEALEFISKQRIIEISLTETIEHIELSVKDNGQGIAKEIENDIFVPFFTTKENGSGIGLPLCRELLNLHHASLFFSSGPNMGTTFYIQFHKSHVQ